MNTYDSSTWPRRFPVYRLGGLLLAIVCGFLLLRLWRSQLLPLQISISPIMS